MNAKTKQYFMAMWPILMSLGLGGSVVHMIYSLYYWAWRKFMERWMCTVAITDREPIFE